MPVAFPTVSKGWLLGNHCNAYCGPFTLGGLEPSAHQPFKLTSQFFYTELHGNRGASLAGKVDSRTKIQTF